MKIDAGNGGVYELDHAVFDVNGTLSCDGLLLEGVIERIHALRQVLKVHILTADTYGTQDKLINIQLAVDTEPKIAWKILKKADGPEDRQKESYIGTLKGGVVAIGNGRNDKLMLQAAKLGIVVLGPEGASAESVVAARVIAHDPTSAIDLLLHPPRLKATLRF
jgi:soluble P-type ATPase